MTGNDLGGTPVTLVIPAGATTPTVLHHPTAPPPSHLAFTGFDATTAFALVLLLLVTGVLLVFTGLRPAPRRTS